MAKNEIWELIAKKLSGEATADDLHELENLLRANPDMHYPIQIISDLWHHSTPDTEDAQLAFSTHADRMKTLGVNIDIEEYKPYEHPIPAARSKWFISSLVSLAVIAVVYFSYSSFFKKSDNTLLVKQQVDKSEVSTRYGSRTNLKLPDGTQVWLNSGSKLTYDKTYGNDLREVALTGEAYFDVVKNPAHPFVIHTISINIKVLGTAFNVKSFPGEKNTETSLIRGSIEVTFKNKPSKKVILKPNEKLITSNADTIIGLSAVNTSLPAENIKPTEAKEADKQTRAALVSHLTYAPSDSTVIETSWMENKLIFRSEKFEDLAVRMERWYGVNIRFADEAIKTKRLNGIFEKENIQQALKTLQQITITPFSYKINKDEIIISSK